MDMRIIYTRQNFIWQGGWSHLAPLPSLVIAPQHPPLSSLPLLAYSTITITIARALLCHRNPAPSTIVVIATWHLIVQHLHYMKTSLIEIWWRSYFKEYENVIRISFKRMKFNEVNHTNLKRKIFWLKGGRISLKHFDNNITIEYQFRKICVVLHKKREKC